MSETSVPSINDVLHQIKQENRKLKNHLLLAKNLIKVLLQFKTYLDNYLVNCNCIANNNIINNNEFDDYETQFKSLINKVFINENESQLKNNEQIENESINSVENEDEVTDEVTDESEENTEQPVDNQTNVDPNNTEVSDKKSYKYIYVCDWNECQFKTYEQKVFEKHIDIHRNEDQFKSDSDNCGESSMYFKALINHKFHSSNNETSFVCTRDDCQFTSKSLKSMNNHLRAHKRKDLEINCPEKELICEWSECQFKTFNEQVFKDHMNIHTEETPYKCEEKECQKSFMSLSSLKFHKRRVHSDKLLNCSWIGCEFSTKWSESLKQHFLNHTGNKVKRPSHTCPPMACDWPGCDFTTQSKTNLKDHKNSHIGLKAYSCEECGKSFGSRMYLTRHKLRIHKFNDAMRIKCQFPNCGLLLKKNAIKAHMKRHNNEGKYTCDWPDCGYKCDQLSIMTSHQNKHKPQKLFKCTVSGCDSSFPYKGSLTKHLRYTHSNDKSYSCEWPACEASFKTPFNLKVHLLTHIKDKKYICDFPNCEFRTHTKQILLNHKQTHSSQREFVCDVCDKAFVTLSVLRSHKKSHLNIKYKCEWAGCDKMFYNRSYMRKHMRTSHPLV